MTNLLTNNWSSSFVNLWMLSRQRNYWRRIIYAGIRCRHFDRPSAGETSTASIRQLDRYIVSGCAALSTSGPICRGLRNHGDFFLMTLVDVRPDLWPVIKPVANAKRRAYITVGDYIKDLDIHNNTGAATAVCHHVHPTWANIPIRVVSNVSNCSAIQVDAGSIFSTNSGDKLSATFATKIFCCAAE